MRKGGLGARPQLSAAQGTEQEGQDPVECGLLLGVVAVVMFAALTYLKEQIVAGYSVAGLNVPMS